MVQELVSKYIWLVDIFSKASPGGLSLGQVFSRWERRWGEPYSRRSFFNHRTAIYDIFGIDIKCNMSTKMYYIDAEDLEDGKNKSSWLIDSFTVNNLLSLGKERLSGRVSVAEIPSGHKWLMPLMDSMLADEVLELTYQKYTGEEPHTRTVHPYALKESSRRWYLAALDTGRGEIRVYGLDRILSIKPTGNNFRLPDDFDADTLFRNSFGVYISDRKDLRHIVLRANERETRYLRDLPLHHSQEEQEPGLFTLDIAVTEDFVMELLSRGNRLEVLAPAELRDRLRNEFSSAAEIYKNSII